jgi:hypothetical protein
MYQIHWLRRAVYDRDAAITYIVVYRVKKREKRMEILRLLRTFRIK